MYPLQNTLKSTRWQHTPQENNDLP